MNTKISKIKGDWQEVVNTCRATSGKGPLGHEPSKEFKRRILIAEHSPIRRISVSWIWEGVKSWIATHWSRHQADRETRAYASDLKATLHIKQPEISDVLVPNCVYRCGCPELESCGLFKTWQMSCADIASTDIQKRYDAYNTIFWAVRGEVFDGRDSGD